MRSFGCKKIAFIAVFGWVVILCFSTIPAGGATIPPAAPSNLKIGSVTTPPDTTPPTPTGNDGLLSGMTPGDYKVPSGWSLVVKQDFEGTLTSAESRTSQTSISTTRPHTGNKSLEGTYTGDASDVSWWLKQGNSGAFSEIYISFYDYQESQMRFNEELFLVDIGKFTSDYALQFQLTADYYGMGDGPPPAHTGFNSDYAYMVLVSNSVTGNGFATKGNYWWKKESTKGQWIQWEVHYRPNTKTNNVANFDGFYRLYKNGVLFASVEKDVLNGTTDWTQPYIQVGGVYTKIKWETKLGSGICTAYVGSGWGDAQAGINFNNCPCPNQCPPNGQVPVYKRFIDDIIVMKK